MKIKHFHVNRERDPTIGWRLAGSRYLLIVIGTAHSQYRKPFVVVLPL